MILVLALAGCFSWRSTKDGGTDLDGDGDPAIEDGGTDCWDDPDAVPNDFIALNGFPQPSAADVHPGAAETWYDGIDQDCAGDGDFDQDGDGHASSLWPETRGEATYDDCYDAVEDEYPSSLSCEGTGAVLDPAEVHPDAADEWYDGTDADCAGNDDFDQDGDGHAACAECDDTDADNVPATEVWYNGIDEDCDGNDGDQDGDGYDSTLVGGDDCWDDPAEAHPALNGLPALTAAEVHPGTTETWYDGVDEDCDGASDFDQDEDGWDSADWPNGDGEWGWDCDDEDPAIYLGAEDDWYDGVDADCMNNSDYDADGDGHDSVDHEGDDCDDGDAAVHPGLAEDCATEADDDCDYVANEPDATGCTPFYADADGDGYNTADSLCMCEAPEGYIEDVGSRDCDDGAPTVHPGAEEVVADGVDEDCDGDELCYVDSDADGHTPSDPVTAASADLDCDDAGEAATATDDDCDDGDPAAYTGAPELVGDEVDEDCDGGEVCHADGDDDGHASTTDTITSGDTTCGNALGEAPADMPIDDCDDGDATIHGGQPDEPADGVDGDCDGMESCFLDGDDDGFTPGTIGPSADLDCTGAGELSAMTKLDCDDTDATVHPDATEIPADGIDEDCDLSELCYVDGDNDGFGSLATESSTALDCDTLGIAATSDDCDDSTRRVYPGADELCDGMRNDCRSSSWADEKEDGLVTAYLPDGTWVDMTATFAAGTYTSPARVTPSTPAEAWVCRGTWYVNLGVADIDLTIHGPYGAAETILDGAGSSSVVEVADANVVFSGVTLQDGVGRTAGASLLGGGVYVIAGASSTASVHFDACEINDNIADKGGAIYTQGRVDVVLNDTVLRRNEATKYGGGVFVDAGTVSCAGQTGADYGFFDNVASEGGALYFGVAVGTGTFDFTDCDFSGNTPQDIGSVGSSSGGEALGMDASGSCSTYTGC